MTTDVAEAVTDATVIFLAVGTPSAANGEADLSQVTSAVTAIAPHLRGYRVVATKSTVPVGTGGIIRQLLAASAADPAAVDVVSNPEFLREGSAISDFLRPDRVVIGTSSDRAASVMREIYRPLYLIETPIVVTSLESAEMIKYAANAFLAVKISYINEIANLCEKTGADVHVVAKAMGLDKRIGSKFLHPGPGYGGSCFPKDTRALASIGERCGLTMEVVSAAIRANEAQRGVMLEKIAQAADGLAERTIGMLGIAFKPNTSDIRESPAWRLCRDVAAAGARVRVFDPVAMTEASRELDSSRILFVPNAYEAAAGSDALVIATEWNEFRTLDLEQLRTIMRRPVVVDTRNVLEPDHVRSAGFTYFSTGRGVQPAGSPVGPATAALAGR
jgi:UDPglucose 6-dehydrogenase